MEPQNIGDLQLTETIIKNDFKKDFNGELISTEPQKELISDEDREPEQLHAAQKSLIDTIENSRLERNDAREEAKDSEQLDNASKNKSLVMPTPIKLPGTAKTLIFEWLLDILKSVQSTTNLLQSRSNLDDHTYMKQNLRSSAF